MASPSLVAQMVKNLPTVKETWLQSLGWEDPLEEGMTSHFSIFAWRISWTEEPGGLQRAKKSQTQLSDKAQHTAPLYGGGRKGYYLENKGNQQKNQDYFS